MRSETPINSPRHVAIIMDGNGRWANARGLPRTAGHRAGVDRVSEAVRTAAEADIEYLTLFAFSSENRNRPEQEVSDLMGLLRFFIRRDLAELHRENVRSKVIGCRQTIQPDIQALLNEA
ncbi:MAG: di-trans,poly-cis-decaprenylcistransferase, partial [Candidatus Omnitrophica bacterium]|nr:di-trans,poly-cis-decaprenylcistransferase [Candidatus Omnitrophota bacterium]